MTAGDIETDGTVEVLNPDLHIATVSEGGHLVIDMTAEMGRGYNTAEKNKKPRTSNRSTSNRFYLYTSKKSKLFS